MAMNRKFFEMREEERQLALLNNSNFDIVDDGRLSDHHMWTVRIVGGVDAGKMLVHEDVVREARDFNEAMDRWDKKKRAKAKRAAAQRAAAEVAAASSSSSAADPDEELKAKLDALGEKRRRIDAEEADVQAELEKNAKKRRIQAELDAADAKAKTEEADAKAKTEEAQAANARAAAAAAERDRLRAELESA